MAAPGIAPSAICPLMSALPSYRGNTIALSVRKSRKNRFSMSRIARIPLHIQIVIQRLRLESEACSSQLRFNLFLASKILYPAKTEGRFFRRFCRRSVSDMRMGSCLGFSHPARAQAVLRPVRHYRADVSNFSSGRTAR